MLRYLSVFFVTALSLVAPAIAATPVGGIITTTTWTKAFSPYRVTDTIFVPSNNTLTIEPGVDVLFDTDVQFIVQGKLYAVGTQADSIRFLKGTSLSWRGIRITGGDTSTIAYTRISDGVAQGIAEKDSCGGALYLSGDKTRVDMSNSIISGNMAPYTNGNGGGGGIFNGDSATLTMTNCTVSNNAAIRTGDRSWGYGGGIYNCEKATLTMTNCTISGNLAINGGGILNDATMTMTNCTVSDNKASYFGSGVANRYYNTTLTMKNCTINGNIVVKAVLNDFGAKLTMINCTVSENTRGFMYNANGAELTMTNCIVWANSGSTETEIRRQSGTISIWYSDVQGGIPTGVTDGGGNINVDPLFMDAENGDYHLLVDSPCIDTGDPDSPLDSDGTRADMGAFPYVHPIIVLVGQQPSEFVLYPNFPNPFNPSTTIRFSLPGAGPVLLSFYDVNGRLVRTLIDGTMQAGLHEVVWNGRDQSGRAVASGIYLYRLTSGKGIVMRKMALVR